MGVVNLSDSDRQAEPEAAKRRYLGVMMLCGADRGRYGKLVEELQNDFTKGNNYCPTNMTEAYNLLVNYKMFYKPPTRLADDSEEALFANIGGSKGKSKSHKSGGGTEKGRYDATSMANSATSP